MQATAKKKKKGNTAMKMVPKVNFRFPQAKLWPYWNNPFKHSSLTLQRVAVDSPTVHQPYLKRRKAQFSLELMNSMKLLLIAHCDKSLVTISLNTNFKAFFSLGHWKAIAKIILKFQNISVTTAIQRGPK